MAERWPPPVSLGDELGVLPVVEPGGPSRRRRLRRVRVWGRPVWVDDESGRVWCPECRRLVDAAQLGRLDKPHHVGLPRRVEGRLLPLGDDEPAGPGGDDGDDAA